jgi:hypothetical protein
MEEEKSGNNPVRDRSNPQIYTMNVKPTIGEVKDCLKQTHRERARSAPFRIFPRGSSLLHEDDWGILLWLHLSIQ